MRVENKVAQKLLLNTKKNGENMPCNFIHSPRYLELEILKF